MNLSTLLRGVIAAQLLALAILPSWSEITGEQANSRILGQTRATRENQARSQTARPESHPLNPTADISWSPASYSGVLDIQAAFNNAHQAEGAQLGIYLPPFVMPSQQSIWDGLSNGGKALYLINQERQARNVHLLDGIETNVMDVAQTYANYILSHNSGCSHAADGRTYIQRMQAKPAINSCNDGYWSENLYCTASSESAVPLPIEQAIYQWMYADSAHSWGHRINLLYYPYNDNSSPPGIEGFLGIGLAAGPYLGLSSGAIVVMDSFDPCAAWTRIYLPAILKTSP
jgi:hypothetical protein